MARDITAERKDIDKVVEGQTVCSMFQDAVREHASVDALKWKVADEWKAKTWAEYGDAVRDFGNGMISFGLKPGEFLNIIGANRPEYYFTDLGTMHAGGIPVSLYNTLAPEQLSYIVNHCEAVYVVAENRDFYERFLKIKGEIPNVRKIILFDDAEEFADDDWAVSFDEVMEAGREFAKTNPDELEQRWTATDPDDLATLIYTSGTTGPPKGVMVSHYNVCWTTESLMRMSDLGEGTRHISYLPLAHIAERMTGLYLHMKGGMTCHFCPNPREIATYLGEVRPQFFFAVPRVWEKIYQGVNAQMAGAEEGQRKAAERAFELGLEKVRLEQAGKDVPEELAKQVEEEAKPVFDFVKSLVGLDEVEIVSSGAAPLAAEIIEWYHALGVPIAEVYGQSEDTGPTSWNRPEQVKIGTVGPTIPGCEVKLADDGELLVRGGNVTKGYYKEPEKTSETFSEGWLYSGDIAEIDEDGFIRIVDRKKEIIITAGGKNIAPSNSENLLKTYPLVGQVAVIGDRRPYLTALIVLDAENAEAWAKEKGKPTDLKQLATDADVVAEIQRCVDEVNEQLHRQEQIKKFTILPTEWTAESEELTPTLKLKRRVVENKYESEIESMYA